MTALIRLAAICGLVGVGLGALGGHRLEPMLEEAGRVADWQTATRYLLIHAVACLVVGLSGGRVRAIAGWLFGIGALVFAVTLYAICLTGITKFGIGTPFGGLAMLGGWAALLLPGRRQV